MSREVMAKVEQLVFERSTSARDMIILNKVQTLSELERLSHRKPKLARAFVSSLTTTLGEQIRTSMEKSGKQIPEFSVSNSGLAVWLAMNLGSQIGELCANPNESGETLSGLELGGFIRTQPAPTRAELPIDAKRVYLYQDGLKCVTDICRTISNLYGHSRDEARTMMNEVNGTFHYAFKLRLSATAKRGISSQGVPLVHPFEKHAANHWLTWLADEMELEDKQPPSGISRFSGTRLAVAKLDQTPGVNQEALDSLIRQKMVIPVKNRLLLINRNRVSRGLAPVTEEEAEKLFLIPIRWPGKHDPKHDVASNYLRDPHIWGRSDFKIGTDKTVIIKGHGVPPDLSHEVAKSAESTEKLPSVKLSIYHDPNISEILEQQFRGGVRQESVNEVVNTLDLLRNAYRRALDEKDPVALFAYREGIRDLPIPTHIASFQPLEIPGFEEGKQIRLQEEKTGRPWKTWKVNSVHPPRIRVSDLDYLGHLKDKWRVWFYQQDHPHRLWEMQEPTRPISVPAILRPAGIQVEGKTLTKNGQKIEPNQAANIVTRRHAVATALLVHLYSHRLGGSFFTRYGSVFSANNTGPGEFFDFDTAGIVTASDRRQTAYEKDVTDARNRIRETARLVGLRLGADRLPISQNVALFNRLIKMGKTAIAK